MINDIFSQYVAWGQEYAGNISMQRGNSLQNHLYTVFISSFWTCADQMNVYLFDTYANKTYGYLSIAFFFKRTDFSIK